MKRKTEEMAQTDDPFMKSELKPWESKAARLKAVIGILISAALLVGCGGDGSGSHMASSSPSLMTGTFVDSPVEGLEYETETQTGMTDVDGTFMYMPGETIAFYVGDIMLGGAMAKSMMTPLDLVDGAVDETHPMVTNMARFLQTLDADLDPENGITITQEMAEAMIGHMVDFDMDMYAFEHSSDMLEVMETVNMMDASMTGHMMVSIEDAQTHLGTTMADMMNGDYGMTDSSGMMPNNDGGMPVDSTLMSGTFVDSPVEGLEYETETQTGMTDVDGTFMYIPGETIAFYVGDIMLGGAMAKYMMTPVDLVNGAVDETHPMVTNMARFLQTLDVDMNPENGITITEEMADAMIGHMVDFDMDMYGFEYDPDMQAVMNTINSIHPSDIWRMMVSIEDAQNHLANTMAGMMGGDSGMTDGENMPGNGSGMMGGDYSDMSGTDSGMMDGDYSDMPGTDSGMMGGDYSDMPGTDSGMMDGNYSDMPGNGMM